MAEKPWGGRFSGETDPRVEAFTESISFDYRLAAVDVRGSQAHARMLADVGLLDEVERDAIVAALDQILDDIISGAIPRCTELEDVHMHIESALIERLGDAGRKLHTGRSRNDQVSTDLKLYVRDSLDQIDSGLLELQRAFVSRHQYDSDIILPAYTHLQRAQPVMATQYWLAYCEKLGRDRGRLADCRRRLNLSPLGGAALAGTSLPIDRQQTAEALGFDGPAGNSIDISSDRDFLVEFTSALALIAVHLSGWAEEWILWCSTEFDMIKLPDAYTTGSSIMPQKRNPDVLELIRGKSARVIASANQLLVLLKGLPLAYNRDLQEDKIAVFDAIDTTISCLELAPAIVDTARLQTGAIASRLEDGFLDATALMEYLIRLEVPMRSAHETVGRLVARCESEGTRLKDLELEQFQAVHESIDAGVYDVLGAENAARILQSEGSGGPEAVARSVAAWREKLGLD